MGEHGLETFAGDVAWASAVDGVAHGHVVGGHGFGDGAGGAADFEEPRSGFLTGSDFGEGAVFGGIEVELEGFVAGGEGGRAGHDGGG